jgi:hypothetical protein
MEQHRDEKSADDQEKDEAEGDDADRENRRHDRESWQ